MFKSIYSEFDMMSSLLKGDSLTKHTTRVYIHTDNEEERVWITEALGMTKEDISLVVEDHKLTLKGSTETPMKSQFNVTFTLPSSVNANDISARLENGWLYITGKKNRKDTVKIEVE